MASKLAIASAVAGAGFLLVATAVALVTMEMAKAAPSAGGGGIVLVLGAAVGLAVAGILWIIGNILMLVSYLRSRGERSRVVAGACFLATLLHLLFLAGFIGLQSGRMSLDAAIVASIALLLAIGYGVAGVKRLRGPRLEFVQTS